MDALARAIARMHAAGHGKKDQHEWPEHGRVEMAKTELESAKGINAADEAIKDTMWVKYKIKMSDKELLALSNSLVAVIQLTRVGAKLTTLRIFAIKRGRKPCASLSRGRTGSLLPGLSGVQEQETLTLADRFTNCHTLRLQSVTRHVAPHDQHSQGL